MRDADRDYEAPAHAAHHHSPAPNPRREPSNRRVGPLAAHYSTTADGQQVPRHEEGQVESYGSMGDFKLPPNPSRRRPLEKRDPSPPRNNASNGKLGKSADQGTFRNRDGRSEDSGWRAKRDAAVAAQQGRGVNIERKPAWMDESDSALARSPPPWASSSSPVSLKIDHSAPRLGSSPNTKSGMDEIQQFKAEMKAMESKKEVPSTKEVKAPAPSGIGLTRPVEHVDEIQKFKADMKEMERRRKEASDKAEGKVQEKQEQKMAPPPGSSKWMSNELWLIQIPLLSNRSTNSINSQTSVISTNINV